MCFRELFYLYEMYIFIVQFVLLIVLHVLNLDEENESVIVKMLRKYCQKKYLIDLVR